MGVSNKMKPEWFYCSLQSLPCSKGFHQRPDIDFIETIIPVVKPATIHLILSLVVSHGWVLNQLDVNNAFLQGTLSNQVFMQ